MSMTATTMTKTMNQKDILPWTSSLSRGTQDMDFRSNRLGSSQKRGECAPKNRIENEHSSPYRFLALKTMKVRICLTDPACGINVKISLTRPSVFVTNFSSSVFVLLCIAPEKRITTVRKRGGPLRRNTDNTVTATRIVRIRKCRSPEHLLSSHLFLSA